MNIVIWHTRDAFILFANSFISIAFCSTYFPEFSFLFSCTLAISNLYDFCYCTRIYLLRLRNVFRFMNLFWFRVVKQDWKMREKDTTFSLYCIMLTSRYVSMKSSWELLYNVHERIRDVSKKGLTIYSYIFENIKFDFLKFCTII